MPFVERHDRDGHHVVVLRYAALFYWLMWPTLAVSLWAGLVPSRTATIAAIVAWLLLLSTAIPYWPIVFELRRRMRTGYITASGSKYSFSSPLTYTWPNAEGEGENK